MGTTHKRTGKITVKRTVEYLLGKTSKEQSLKTHTFSGKNTGKNFIEELYEDGTVCDITNTPRTISVRYKCFPDKSNIEIMVPDEVSSCVYHMDVHVPELCQHPDFMLEPTPSHEIICYPEGVEAPDEQILEVEQHLQ